jgi:Tfp pilus assembly protein PilF
MAGLLLIDSVAPAVSAGTLAPQGAAAVYAGGDQNAACAGCHKEIYERYRKTPMANASGLAAEGFRPGGFRHGPSGVEFRIEEEGGRVYLAFERRPTEPGLGVAVTGSGESAVGRELKGRRELKYFVGSGRRGRTYLFEQEGYWFESPVNWYAKKRVWDMAPGYLTAREMPLTIPVDPGCLRCHSTGAQVSLPEARNRYAGAPFLHGGIGCASCHGDGSAHVASGGRTAMVKVDGLSAVRGVSICLNCHLEGEEAVVREGRRLVDFQPGESIFDYASYFVRESEPGGAASDARATSQWEALLQSGCRRGAGERLTCTSCHDPHTSASAMSAEERSRYYRARCLACHGSESTESTEMRASGTGQRAGFATTHHAENPDCTACHMPQVSAKDIAHEQVTDHQIPRNPPVRSEKASRRRAEDSKTGTLVAVGDGSGVAGDGGKKDQVRDQVRDQTRDLGLAYAMAAAKGDAGDAERARGLLREAEEMPGSAGDHTLHAQLGFLEQIAGDKVGAAREYGLALAADAEDSFAAGNLALLKAGDRRYGEAVALWERAFANDPVQLTAGMNLAVVQCGLGEREAALGTLDRILEYSPDDGQAWAMARKIRMERHACGGR